MQNRWLINIFHLSINSTSLATLFINFASIINDRHNIVKSMIFKIITIFLIVFSTLVSFGQQTGESIQYKRYEGSIGNDINVTANIIRLFEKLSGNYQYSYLEENGEMYYGKTIEVSGEIDKNKATRLKEFGRDEFTFNGKMEDDIFTGTWHAPDNKKVPFMMKEYYPKGSMEFEVYYLRSEGKLNQQEAKSPVAEIELTLLFPEQAYFDPKIIDSVRQIITNGFFGSDFKLSAPDSMLISFEEEYLDNYVKQNKNWHASGTSFNWEKSLAMSVIYNSSYLLCLEYLRYAYAGGSHGMTNISYNIVQLDKGKLLTYSDVFVQEADSALSVLLTKQLREDYKIPEEVTLKQAGFFVADVEPNDNIYIDGNGIGFLFNSYEIAPYSQGTTNIFLEYKQIQHLVKMGTPVYEMSHR